jgi:hypothetical protein
MSNDPHDAGAGRTEDEAGHDEEPIGAEVGMTEEGSTFEPEEDPEGHAD